MNPSGALAVDFRLHLHGNAWIVWIGLQGIEHHLGDCVLEGGAIARDHNRLITDIVSQLRGFDRLVFLGFLVGFFDQLWQRHRFHGGDSVLRQKAHLVNQPGDSPDAFGHRRVE